MEVRRILVHSTGNAKGQQRARDKRLAKARDELDKLQRGAGGRYDNTAHKTAARIGVIAKTRRVTGCLHTEITTDAAPSPRPPRPGTNASPLARNLNELPATYGATARQRPP
ncbi:hypothetical protein ABZZ74_50835 [Streptomyces sp. NPDC006476]|uniref:hypothetical protein n=1 Tax=Streptomyces sp. NPDC006476 TaxID=3157175 RepID=UPI0033AC55F0